MDDPALSAVPVSAESRELLKLRRSDLAATLALYRQESSGRSGWLLLAFGFFGLLTGIPLSMLGERMHWSEAWAPVVIVGAWVPMLTALFVLLRREQKLRARLQLFCPACAAPFLDRGAGRGISRADLAVASGCCQHCGEEVLARDGE